MNKVGEDEDLQPNVTMRSTMSGLCSRLASFWVLFLFPFSIFCCRCSDFRRRGQSLLLGKSCYNITFCPLCGWNERKHLQVVSNCLVARLNPRDCPRRAPLPHPLPPQSPQQDNNPILQNQRDGGKPAKATKMIRDLCWLELLPLLPTVWQLLLDP